MLVQYREHGVSYDNRENRQELCCQFLHLTFCLQSYDLYIQYQLQLI